MSEDERVDLLKQITLLTKKVQRENQTKVEAERLLEEKSRELFLAQKIVEDNLLTIKSRSEQDIALLHLKSHLESILLEFNQMFLKEHPSGKQLQRLVDHIADIEYIQACQLTLSIADGALINSQFNAGPPIDLLHEAVQEQPCQWSDDGYRLSVIIQGGTQQLGRLGLLLNTPASWQETIEKQILLFCDMLRSAYERQALLNRTLEEKRRAEQSERTARDFVAMINHELRTPLSGLLGSADLMRDTQMTPQQQQLLKTMHQSGELLEVIINDLLDISKINAGMLKIMDVKFSPEQLCLMIQNIFTTKTTELGLTFEFSYSNQLPAQLIGDPDRIKQLFVNLIGNAIKFTDKGKISVNIDWAEERFIFTISDSGCGIPEDKQANIFEPFIQVNNSNNSHEGTGLGLAICKLLVDEMKGDISLDSGLNRGSTFSVSLPLKASEDPPVLSSDEEVDLPLDRLSVLVVEDSEVNRLLISLMLGKLKIKPFMANNGQQAVSFLADKAVDIVLMDCRMPVMDGFEATRQLRQSHYRRPIIALTASTTSLEIGKCYESGMDEIIYKPYKLNDIKKVLTKWYQKLLDNNQTDKNLG
ncbi:ATP-binding protein [uncultured Shewanella sp.]|uniref:ATP-binding protein n=1 Tax=uncultured Shewanella sp. TaxID=173975 RepID=UPI002622AA04|nr:ATP-binding protein [uncultured Shewanella sp.]